MTPEEIEKRVVELFDEKKRLDYVVGRLETLRGNLRQATTEMYTSVIAALDEVDSLLEELSSLKGDGHGKRDQDHADGG